MESASKEQTYAYHAERATALMDALYAYKGALEPGNSYERLRESYATGKITLEQFEAQVSDLLQSAR